MAIVIVKSGLYSAIGTLLGAILTPFAIRLAAHADGWAIGDPVFMPLLYPYSTLLFLIPGSAVFFLLLVLGVCQFPVYGLILGDAAAKGATRFMWTAVCIGLFHLTAVGVCHLIGGFA